MSDASASLAPDRRSPFRRDLQLLVRSVRAENRLFWRTPIGAFFTIGLPLVMLVIFVAIFGNDPIGTSYGEFATAQFYAASLGVFAAASATYTNLAINLTMRRDDGVLKRVRGTPIPPWVFLAGAILSGMWIAAFATTLMVGIGIVAYGVDVQLAQLPAMIVAFLAGTACFATLGVALAAVEDRVSGPRDRERHDPPAGVPLERLRPPRGSAVVAEPDRRHLPAEAVRGRLHRSDVAIQRCPCLRVGSSARPDGLDPPRCVRRRKTLPMGARSRCIPAGTRPTESTQRRLTATLRVMLSRFDDYPIHQTPDPVAHPATSDKDVYERYWFNGYSTSGDFYLGAGAALYQHLGVKDAHVSFIHEGRQYAFHVSGRRSDEPSDLTIGPYSLEIIEPMRSCRITVTENDTDFTCDLLWEGRTGNVEEPRHHLGRGLRKIMDTTRFTQLGRWTGWVQFGDVRIELDPSEVVGTKDRSWGVRPLIGGDTRGAPAASQMGGIFFLWAPLNFDDLCLHYQLFDDNVGRPLFQVGARLPVYGSPDELPGVEDPAVEHMRNLEHEVTFASGNRMITGATIAMTSVADGARHEVRLEPIFTFRMKGIGYTHPIWVHGKWHDELAMASESWALDDVDDTAYENQHCQHLVRATYTDGAGVERTGIGVLEQNILGPYAPYGLEGFFAAPTYD